MVKSPALPAKPQFLKPESALQLITDVYITEESIKGGRNMSVSFV